MIAPSQAIHPASNHQNNQSHFFLSNRYKKPADMTHHTDLGDVLPPAVPAVHVRPPHPQQYQASTRLRSDTPLHHPAFIKRKEQDIIPQSPQPIPSPPRPSHLLIPTPTPSPPPLPPSSSKLQMRRNNRTNKPSSSTTSKERVLKLQAPEERVNFPCHEDSLNEEQKQQLKEMQLYPTDGVSRYCRKIPFKGAKAQLFEITGRHEFNRKLPPAYQLLFIPFPFPFPFKLRRDKRPC